jgi:hypothetical protein
VLEASFDISEEFYGHGITIFFISIDTREGTKDHGFN